MITLYSLASTIEFKVEAEYGLNGEHSMREGAVANSSSKRQYELFEGFSIGNFESLDYFLKLCVWNEHVRIPSRQRAYCHRCTTSDRIDATIFFFFPWFLGCTIPKCLSFQHTLFDHNVNPLKVFFFSIDLRFQKDTPDSASACQNIPCPHTLLLGNVIF